MTGSATSSLFLLLNLLCIWHAPYYWHQILYEALVPLCSLLYNSYNLSWWATLRREQVSRNNMGSIGNSLLDDFELVDVANAWEGLGEEPFGVITELYRFVERRVGLRDQLLERFDDRVRCGHEKIRQTVPPYRVVGHRSMHHALVRLVAENLPPPTQYLCTQSAHIQLDFSSSWAEINVN